MVKTAFRYLNPIKSYDHLKFLKGMRNHRILIPKVVFTQFTNVRDLGRFCFHTHTYIDRKAIFSAFHFYG